MTFLLYVPTESSHGAFFEAIEKFGGSLLPIFAFKMMLIWISIRACMEYSYFALKWKIGYYSRMLENTFRLSSFFFYLIKFKARIDQQYRDKLFIDIFCLNLYELLK